MKKFIMIGSLIFLTILTGCFGNLIKNEQGNLKVIATITEPDFIITSINIRLTQGDIVHEVTETIDPTTQEFETIFSAINVGEWLIEVSVFNNQNILIYQGSKIGTVSPNTTNVANITLDPVGRIEGYTFYSNKANHEGILVTVGSKTTTTDHTGYYSFSNIPVGNYILQVDHANYYSNNAIVKVSHNATSIVENLYLYPIEVYGTVSGNAKYLDKNDCQGIAIKIQALDGQFLPDLIAETDANGDFYFPHVPVDPTTNSAKYIFTAFALDETLGYSSENIEFEVTGGINNFINVDFILRPTIIEVMIFADDTTPWNSNALHEILDELDVPYEIFTSIDIPNVFLPLNKMVWIINDQPQPFYDTYAAYQSKFDEFVSNGGTLLFEACDNGWNSGSILDAGGTLPCNVVNEHNYCDTNIVVNPTHPMMTGVPIDLYGNYASHNYFINLPTAHTILTVDEENNPTLVEYRYNLGRVITTGQPLEYHWANDQNPRIIYSNLIYYTFNLPIPEIVPESLDSNNQTATRSSGKESIN